MKKSLSTLLTLALLSTSVPLANAGAERQGDRFRVSSDTLGVHHVNYSRAAVIPTGFTFRGSQIEDIELNDIRFVTNIDADGDSVGHWGVDAGVNVYEVINSVQLVDVNGNQISGFEGIDRDGSIRFDNLDYVLPANQLTSIYLKVDLANRGLSTNPIEIYFDVQNVHDDILGTDSIGNSTVISRNHANFPNRGASRLHIVY